MKVTDHNDSFTDILKPSGDFWLSDVRLERLDSVTAIFKAKLNGPIDSPVWARAWLSTEAGTLAETASAQLKAGDHVTLKVTVTNSEPPESAYMRIESAPLNTEHMVGLKFDLATT